MNAFAAEVGVEINYACLSVDGAPFMEGSAAAGECCSGGQLTGSSDNCRAGFAGTIDQSANSALTHMSLAGQELNTAATALTGGTSNTVGGVPTPSEVGSADVGMASSSAESVGRVTSDSSASRAKSGMGGAGSGSGGSGGGGSAGGGSFGSIPSLSASKGEKLAMNAPKGDPEGGSYSGGAKGAKEEKKFDPFAALLNRGGEKKAQGRSGEIRFGDAAGKGEAAPAGAPFDDGKDYLSRLGKEDNLFKVVSRRYVKETERKNIDPIEKSVTQ
jgi:hypothetical protein